MTPLVHKATCAALVAVAIWSVSFVATKHVVTEAAPMASALVRFLMASTLLLLVHALLGRSLALPRDCWRLVVWGGLTGTTFTFAFENLALTYTTAGNSAMLQAVSPTLAAIGAWLFLRERLGWRQWLGMALAAAGIAALIGPTAAVTGPGDMLMGVVMIMGSAYGLISKALADRLPALTALTWMLLVGTLGLVPFALSEALLGEGFQLPQSPTAWAGLAYLGLLSSGGAYLLWQWALAHLPVSRVGMFLYLMPVGTLLVAAAWLGEPLGWSRLGLAALVLFGVYLAVEPTDLATSEDERPPLKEPLSLTS
ncbi:MAG: DMT family transporter [Candidatus Sericytochromatia bacterium]|nr:DMT family transporter [Candidatus Sericytochromatia bacterium]